MKRTDIAMIILTASISMLIAYFAGNALLGNTKNEAVTVKTAEPISKTVTQPDERIFKADAINPTVEVYIGEGTQSQATQ
jgi:hypothetical protein